MTKQAMMAIVDDLEVARVRPPGRPTRRHAREAGAADRARPHGRGRVPPRGARPSSSGRGAGWATGRYDALVDALEELSEPAEVTDVRRRPG